MQSFFSSPRTAAIITNLLYFFTFFADLTVSYNSTPKNNKIIASILPSIAMSRGLNGIASFEAGGVGLTSQNIS